MWGGHSALSVDQIPFVNCFGWSLTKDFYITERNMKNAFRTSILGFVTILVFSAMLLAQSDLGTISGFVRDQSGASVPDATVTVKNQTGIERQVRTNESGFYAITNIPPGFY